MLPSQFDALSMMYLRAFGPSDTGDHSAHAQATQTDMARAVPREAARAALELIPLQRFGRPEEIAEVVVFVASDAAEWFSGQVWVVDGGRTVVEAEHGTG